MAQAIFIETPFSQGVIDKYTKRSIYLIKKTLLRKKSIRKKYKETNIKKKKTIYKHHSFI